MGRNLRGQPCIQPGTLRIFFDGEARRFLFPFHLIRSTKPDQADPFPRVQAGVSNFMESNEEEAPLDPAAERLRRKMVRLLAVSIGVLLVGVMAVLGAVVYKIGAREQLAPVAGNTPSGFPRDLAIDLPEAARVVGASLDGSRIMLHIITAEGAQRLMVYSLDGGGILATVALD